jgi:GTP-sensing pleiotropic transcriptional regulator CodY
MEAMVQLSADAVKQLTESKSIAEKYKKDLSSLDKDAYKDAIDKSSEAIKEIDALIDVFLGKQDDRQGITRSPEVTVMQRLYTASGYVRSRQNGITDTETRLMNHAKEALNNAINEVNTFYNSKWPEYQKAMEALSVSAFKPTKTFKL